MKRFAAALLLAAFFRQPAADEVLYDACESLEVSEKCGVRRRGVLQTAGLSGAGYHIDGRDELLYPLSPRPGAAPYGGVPWRRWSPSRGAIAFSFLPDVNFFSQKACVLAALAQGHRREPDASLIGLFVHSEERGRVMRAAVFDAQGLVLYGGETTLPWHPARPEWRRIVLAWDIDRRYVAFTLDGIGPERACAAGFSRARPAEIPAFGPDVSIGSLYGRLCAPGVYDEIRFYDAPVAVSEDARSPSSPVGLYAGRLLNDAVEDQVWCAYQNGAAQGVFVPGVLGSGIAVAEGGGLLYGAQVPDDGTRGQFQRILFDRGEVGFFMRLREKPGVLVSLPELDVSVNEAGRIFVNLPGATLAGPALPENKWKHLAVGFDRASGALSLKLDGKPERLAGGIGGWRASDKIDPFIRFGVTRNDPVPERRTAVFDLDEIYVYDAPRRTCPEADRVLFHSSFDRPGLYADFALGRIEALGRPISASGYKGRGFLSSQRTLLRYPYHAFYRVGKDAVRTVNASLDTGTACMLVRPDEAAPDARRVLLYLRATGWGGHSSFLYLERGKLFFRHGQVNLVEAPAEAITPGEWRFIAAVWDASSGYSAMYIDGRLIAEKSAPPRPPSGSELPYDAWWAVGSGENAENPFNGVIDELTVWGRVLAPSEIETLHRFYGRPLDAAYPWDALSSGGPSPSEGR
ncbi:MAG TPA: LamG domain-containing protein [Planctomycetes bacterium]|nr:LamG domain-containing protein [Planctomycetota bacterium]